GPEQRGGAGAGPARVVCEPLVNLGEEGTTPGLGDADDRVRLRVGSGEPGEAIDAPADGALPRPVAAGRRLAQHENWAVPRNFAGSKAAAREDRDVECLEVRVRDLGCPQGPQRPNRVRVGGETR